MKRIEREHKHALDAYLDAKVYRQQVAANTDSTDDEMFYAFLNEDRMREKYAKAERRFAEFQMMAEEIGE